MEERECDCTLIMQESSNNKTINLKCMPILSSKIYLKLDSSQLDL